MNIDLLNYLQKCKENAKIIYDPIQDIENVWDIDKNMLDIMPMVQDVEFDLV